MVIIHTADDFIRAMDENPEWLEAVRARILTRELLELPRRLEELSAVVERLATSQTEMKATQDGILATQDRMLATQNQILVTLKQHTGILAEHSDTLKQHTGTLKQHTDTLKQHTDTLKQHTDTLAHLKGDSVEKQLGKKIYGLLGGSQFNMRLAKVVRGYYWTNAMDRFNSAVNAANEAGRISDERYSRIMDTDFIVSARRRGADEDIYLVFEASAKINRHDVDRAIESQDAMKAAFDGTEVVAAVYGWEISEEDRRYAESNGATVFISDPES